jgi:hypothetical protein
MTGVAALDALLHGGFPRGRLSEIHGPASSGKTGLALALAARITEGGALMAWVDPLDRLDPASAAAAGADLTRLFWLRGAEHSPRALGDALSAAGTLAGSGLFEAVLLDLAGVPAHDRQRLPHTTWLRLQRLVEETPTAVVLLAEAHTAQGPGGVSLGLAPGRARFSGQPGPGRLLRGLAGEVRAGRLSVRTAPLELLAFD